MKDTSAVTVTEQATDLGVVEVAGDPLKNDGAVFEGGSNLTEAEAELGLDGPQGLQAELLRVVHGQQRRHQLVQLLLGLLLLNHHSLMQPARKQHMIRTSSEHIPSL